MDHDRGCCPHACGKYFRRHDGGRSAGISKRASFNIGFTLASRGEFSIIMANIGKAGGLDPVVQSFAVLYVLILAVLGPLLTKESKTIYNFWEKVSGNFSRRKQQGDGTG